ncbi:MAG: DUF6282 family protein [Ilumatobacteraceae bacterium]
MTDLLHGVIDIHLHSSPDVRPRSIDDLAAARAAVAQGMAGVVLKNHHAPTADRATVARLAVPGAPVFGGVVLNEGVGGLNPDAVDCFIRLVYQKLYDRFAPHFGRTIRAVFTDEPSLLGR